MPTDEKILTPDDEIAAAAQEFYAEASRTEPPAEPVSDSAESTVIYSRTEKSAAVIQAETYQQQLDEHDRNMLAALDEIISRKTAAQTQTQKKQPQEENTIEKFALGMVRKGAGIVSLALVLIMMGVVVVSCFFSENPDFLLPLKLSPVAAVLLGLELLTYQIISGRKFRIHIPAIVITALIVVGCGFAAVTLNKSNDENKVEYNNRSIAAEIYETGYKELRHAADIAEIKVTVDLNPDGAAKKSGISSLSADDVVLIDVILDGDYSSSEKFAAECKAIIDGYRFLGIPVTNFTFSNDTPFNSFRLDVNGKFMQDYTEAELVKLVRSVIIEDYDYIDDLEDFVGETAETLEIAE